MRFYKLLSVLLDYPTDELIGHVPEIRTQINLAGGIAATEKTALRDFLDHLEARPLSELQASYVQTFDFSAEHSLHLTHHLFGDESDRNRGPALIDLSEMYKEYGVQPVATELPDYLPLVLEFAAGLDEDEAAVFLSDANKVLGVLAENLTKAESPYAPLIHLIEQRATLTRLAA